MKRVILLNGPPLCGKDYSGKVICQYFNDSRIYKFANHLKHMVASAFGLDVIYMVKHKDEKLSELGGKTPREMLIAFSEDFIKPQFGKSYFGDILLGVVTSSAKSDEFIIITDCGFLDEVTPLLTYIDAENIGLIKIERDGCTFDGDSRSYISLKQYGVKETTIKNEGTKSFDAVVIDAVKHTLGLEL